MSALRELQLAVSAAILDGSTAALGQVVGNGLDPVRRLRVYGNNTRENLLQALLAVYPVVDSLVGRGFFRTAASHYQDQHPSRSGDLNRYGAGFPRFLAGYPHARPLPYLADVARLEWALHGAYHAPDAPALQASALAAVAAELGELRLTLHPSARLLASPYPLPAIWALAEGDAGVAVDLRAGASRLLLLRPALEVQLVALEPAEHALLRALRAGATLTQAVARCERLAPALDLSALLCRHLALGTFSDFTLAGTHAEARRQLQPERRTLPC
jgi:hypothetical protein